MKSYSRVLALAAVMAIAATAGSQTKQITRPPASAAAPSAAMSLSDADGQDLILEDLSARTAIHGMLSLTELEFRFRNPKARRIEGRFSCTLPANAAISRFAKEVNGQLMEGEVVERLRANQVYEQFLHQMRDPALLEQDQGNRFSARIFPIEANATVRILLSYSALLPVRGGVRMYSLPLRGLSNIGHFTFRAFVSPLSGEGTARQTGFTHSTSDVYSLEERDYTPPRDIELSWRPTSDAPVARVLTAGDFYLASFRPQVRLASARETHDWLFYIDTSASAADGAEHRIDALERILAALPASDRVQLNVFDNDVAVLGTGTAAEMSNSIRQLLEARLFLGGTDLAGAIRHAARSARERDGRRIVFASDFVATLGETESNQIESALRTLPAGFRIDGLILGSREEAGASKALTAGRGRIVRVPFTESLEDQARMAASSLQNPMGASFDVADAGAEWVYPAHVDDVQPGDEVIVLGKTRAASGVAVRLGGIAASESAKLSAQTFGPLLEREAYRAYLESLARREATEASEGVRRALQTEQVRISVEQRVVIPLTTMLVLESEFDYQRFGLDRRALAAILTIEGGAIGRIDRHTTQPRPLPVPVSIQKSSAAPRAAAGMSGSAVNRIAPAAEAGAVNEPKDVAEGVTGAVQERISVSRAPAVVPPPTPTGIAPPASSPRPAVVEQRPQEATKSDTSWVTRRVPSKLEIAGLQSQLKRDPRDRELCNQLSEALAAVEDWNALRRVALAWQPYDPENPQVYEVLGTADEHLGERAEAARAYASIIEVAAGKPELLQRAGLLLVRVGRAALAETPLRRALALRPDRVNSYRHLALMLWLDGRPEEAARVLESATRQTFPNWYGDAQRVVHEELGYVYRAVAAKSPERRAEIDDRARDFGVNLKRHDALRVTLAWETDANDVDLHVVDPAGEECFYGHKENRSGVTLYEDITQGLGPEVIRTGDLDRGTYHVGVKYFAAGPMGVSRGIVVVVRDRGEGREPSVDIHPFRLVEGGSDVRYVTAVTVK